MLPDNITVNVFQNAPFMYKAECTSELTTFFIQQLLCKYNLRLSTAVLGELVAQPPQRPLWSIWSKRCFRKYTSTTYKVKAVRLLMNEHYIILRDIGTSA